MSVRLYDVDKDKMMLTDDGLKVSHNQSLFT